MTREKEKPICPYCKFENSKHSLIGTSGLVSTSGMESSHMVCKKCNKEYESDVNVKITFNTRKYS